MPITDDPCRNAVGGHQKFSSDHQQSVVMALDVLFKEYIPGTQFLSGFKRLDECVFVTNAWDDTHALIQTGGFDHNGPA